MIIILSANEDPKYFEFWPIVSEAYRKMGYECHLAFLTWRHPDSASVRYLQKYGKVTTFKPQGDIAEFGQAKMIRFLLAATYEDEVCYIDDIDLFPLSKAFIEDKVKQRPKDTLLCVGGEVYQNNGCYPVSQMTAEGNVWKQFINPGQIPYDHLMEQWSQPGMFDPMEDISIKPDWSIWQCFSDEKLLRRLLFENPVPKFELPRGYDNFMESTLDRHDWKIDTGKLNNHGYVNAHCLRPYNAIAMAPLIQYINANYP